MSRRQGSHGGSVRGASGAVRRVAVCLAAVALAAAAAGGAGAQEKAPAGAQAPASGGGGRVEIANEFIRIVVNSSPDATGRFSVSTTGGNPDRGDDDNRPLIYGGAEPWTSFTTVQIDGVHYIFGGPTHRPAGAGGPYGQMTAAPRLADQGQRIDAAWDFPPGVEVTQRLSIARGPTTGLLDTARIEYVATNHDRQPHRVGLRVVIDTMAGSNDGAPFRVGERAVETDTRIAPTQAGIPEFWQVFDSLTQPAVVAQGMLRGGEVTPPDRVYFTNWGVLRESLWDFDFQPGRTFERKGEFELDSAVALFFDPQEIGPGESRSVVIYYGLGGLSIVPGHLAIGLSSPEMAVIGQPDPVSIVAYIQNTGQGTALDVKARLDLPDGLELVPGASADRSLGDIPAGGTVQVTWSARLTARSAGSLTFSVRAEATNAEPNVARRTLRVVNPARLSLQLRGPARLEVVDGRWSPSPFEVTGSVRNDGGADAYGVVAQLVTPYGLQVAPGDDSRRYVGTLQPGEQLQLRWLVVPTGVSGNVPYSLRVSYAGAEEVPAPTNTVAVPPLDAEVLVVPGAGWDGSSVRPGQAFNVEIRGRNLPPFAAARLEVAFDPAVVRLAGGALGVDVGTFFVAAPDGAGGQAPARSAFRVVAADDEAGRVSVETGPPAAGVSAASLVVLRLQAVAPGQGLVQVVAAELQDAAGRVLFRITPQGQRPRLTVTVQAQGTR
ncbi:MAG TPA: hypothetical protein VIK90_04370 [Limnochordales bacterium]